MTKFSKLFSPLRVGPHVMKNRIETGPMSIVETDAKESLSDRAISYYESLAAGGAAVVTIGESIVRTNCGKTHPQQIMLGRDEVRFSLQKVTDAIHAHGALANIEISHGGCMADPAYNGGNLSIGPVGIVDEWGDEIIGMDEAMMDDIAEAFAEAAVTCRDCGFDMVMIHCGHGWLLHQFLSPYYNTRADEYGGDIANRAKFPLMVIDRIRARVGRSIAIDMRISGSEFIEGGLEIDDVTAFCRMCEDRVDMINVSAGAPWSRRMAIPVFEERGVNSAFSAAVKKAVTKIPITTVGGFTDPQLMERYLDEGRADGFVLGRSILADHELPEKARTGREDEIHQCLRCFICNEAQYHGNRTLFCTINPTAGREFEAKMFPPPVPRKKVVVAGGGPGGMEAAVTAAKRGHEVVLFEKSDALGGWLKMERHIPFKIDMWNYAQTLAHECELYGVTVHLNSAATKELVDGEKPDLVICAIGSEPLVPPIDGVGLPNVVGATDMFDDGCKLGHKLVIIGGGLVGCECGLHLAMEGHDVTVVEMREDVAIDSTHDHRRYMMPLIDKHDVKCACGLTVTCVTTEGVTAIDKDGKSYFFPADTVILAAGLKARSEEAESLRSSDYDFVRIGDCLRARKVYNAVCEGFDAATFVRAGG